MTVFVFRSTDQGSPVLTGQAGKLIALLDACLANGYTPAAVTSLVQAGTTVTATLSDADFTLETGQLVTIAGAAPAGANGSFAITVVDPTHFTYTAAGGLGAITGTITYNRSSAGWTKPFSGTNLAAYQQPIGSNGFYLYVDDTGTTTARVTGYEQMTSISTTFGAVNPMPTAVQLSGGGYTFKSNTSDAVARPWLLLSNGKIFYLLTALDSALSYPISGFLGFGDFTSYKSPDPYGTLLYCNSSATNNLSTSGGFQMRVTTQGGALAGQFYARAYTGIGTAVSNASRVSNPALSGWMVNVAAGYSFIYAPGSDRTWDNSVLASNWPMQFPNHPDGGLYVEKFFLLEATSYWYVRGELPGMWCPMHVRPLQGQGDSWTGSGPSAGKTFEVWQFTLATAGSPSQGQLILETSDTW